MTLEDIARNAAVDAIAALCNSGTMEFQTSGDNEVAICTFGATAFGGAASGTATANAISDDADATGGTIDHCVFKKSDTSPILEATCTLSGGGGDLILTSLVIGVDDVVSVTSLTMTQPAS